MRHLLLKMAEVDEFSGYEYKKGVEPKFPDTGCDIVTELLGHESRCLECPLPQCVEDDPSCNRGQYAKVYLRHEDMRNAYYVKGWTVAKIAVEFNVGHRTVQRALVEDREESIGCPVG